MDKILFSILYLPSSILLPMSASLTQLNISPGGMPKRPIDEAMVTAAGVAGDGHRNLKYHGGPDRAICLYSEEWYAWLREQGIDVSAGCVGENFTTRGIDLSSLNVGDRLRVGGCIIELTMTRTPCRNLDQWDKRLMQLMHDRRGWKARIVQDGVVRPGDSIERVISPEAFCSKHSI